jgi:hypothetical protein
MNSEKRNVKLLFADKEYMIAPFILSKKYNSESGSH